MINHYHILFLENFSEIDEVKSSFRNLTFHFKTGNKTESGSYYSHAQNLADNAYKVLSKPKSKEAYDFSLREHLEGYKNEKQDFINEINDLKNENIQLANKVKVKNSELEKVGYDIDVLEERVKVLEGELSRKAKKIESMQSNKGSDYLILISFVVDVFIYSVLLSIGFKG